jgi:hypothetical protein
MKKREREIPRLRHGRVELHYADADATIVGATTVPVFPHFADATGNVDAAADSLSLGKLLDRIFTLK